MKWFLSLVLFLMATCLFAQVVVPPVPEDVTLSSITDLIMFLVKNWKILGTWGIASTVLVILISFIKSPFCGNWFGAQSSLIKRVILVVLGQALAIVLMLAQGTIWYLAIFQGLLVTGGAIAIYEAIKPFLKKKE